MFKYSKYGKSILVSDSLHIYRNYIKTRLICYRRSWEELHIVLNFRGKLKQSRLKDPFIYTDL